MWLCSYFRFRATFLKLRFVHSEVVILPPCESDNHWQTLRVYKTFHKGANVHARYDILQTSEGEFLLSLHGMQKLLESTLDKEKQKYL